MAVPPKFAATKYIFAAPPSSSSTVPHTTHTLELYLDFTCPFSAKIFNKLHTIVFPLVKANPKWASSFSVIFRQQIQPWHPSSTLVHESALAVLQLAPEKFWDYSEVLFREQKAFFDANVVDETRNATYRRLAKLATQVGLSEDNVYGLLEVSGASSGDNGAAPQVLNGGNKATNDVKLITKMNRLIGVHVTPTGVFDGVVQDIGSAWEKEQWQEWLTKNVV